MATNRIRNLVPPPRRVPLPVIVSAMLGTTGGFGAIFLVAGLGFAIVFLRGYRPLDDMRIVLSRTTAQAVVVRADASNATENEERVFEYEYAFTTRRGESRTGRSYSTGMQWAEGETAVVEYVAEDPSISRLRGARTSLFSPFILFVLIFPLVGAALFLSAAYGGLKQAWLLRHGLVGDARDLRAGSTGVTVNNTPVLKYSYEVTTAEGETAGGSAKSFPSDRLGDEELEPALYFPSDPGRSTLLDAIATGSPLEVDESTGEWTTTGGVGQTALYLFAWVAAIGLGGYLFLSMTGIVQ